MQRLIACVLLVLLLIGSTSATTSGETGESRVPGGGTDTINNTTWTRDIRITHNSAGDVQPQIVVDSDDEAHIIWQRSGLWTQRLDRRGTLLTKEVFITPHVVRGYGSPYRYPLGPQIAIDGDANMHVVWDDGNTNVYYQKCDGDGNALAQPLLVGAQDNHASHTPAVAVDPANDDVHIVHDDYQYQCEDILYGKRDKFGKVLVNEFSLSAAVSSHCEHSTLTTDEWGNVHVVFGSAIGCWWRKVDSKGMVQGPAIRIKGPPAYMIASVACTPNGDVHLVWTWNGTVRYSRMDNNGTFLDENISISRNANAPGPPRIVASHNENSVHIVWNDRRTGNDEVYYAKVEEDEYNQTPDNVQLTNDTASSMLPWVDVSSDDNVYVVWSDMRDGNYEIYFKFMFDFAMDLAPVDVAELASMYYFNLDQTKTMDCYIENLGLLQDAYDVEISSDAWAPNKGWEFTTNVTRFEDVEGQTRVFFRVTVTSPIDAFAGNYVNFTVTATSDSGEDDSISWRAFIIVEKGVSVECDEPVKLIAAGEKVRFELTVTNVGDVHDTYWVEHVLLPDDSGWGVVVDKDTIRLDHKASVGVSVNLSSPASAKANDNCSVFLRVQSTTDASVWDGMKVLAIVDPDLHLELEAPVPSMLVDPGGTVEFPIVVRNAGNMPGKVTILVTSSEPRPGWYVLLDAGSLDLAGGEEQVLELTVTAPVDAVAGAQQTVKVTGVTEDLTSSSSVKVTAVVDEVYAVYPVISSNMVALHAGDEATVEMDVTNEGNTLQVLALGTALVPPGWMVTFEMDGAAVQDLALQARETRTVDVVISTPHDARAGVSPQIHIVLTDSEGRSQTLPFQVRIHHKYAVDISAPVHEGAGSPGGTIVYDLSVENMGNGVDTFTLDHGPLPGTGWSAVFTTTDGNIIDQVTLEVGETRNVRFSVNVPARVNAVGPMDLMVSATSTSAEKDEVKLSLSVDLPDLKIVSVTYDPPSTVLRGPIDVTVEVANEGTSRADGVRVVMSSDGTPLAEREVGPIEEGSNVTVTFRWKPTVGRHTLTFSVLSDTPEMDLDNNELEHLRTIEDASDEGPGFGLLMVVMALAAVVVGSMSRRRR